MTFPKNVNTKIKQSFVDLPTDGKTAQSVVLTNTEKGDISVQNPLPADGDSVYVKDLDLDYCDNYNFSGSVSDYFDSLKTVNSDTTSNNPKQIKLWFKRTIYSHSIGFGCDNLGSGFGTSITIKLLGSGEAVRFTKTFAVANSNSFLAEFGPKAFNGVILEFNTSDPICLSNLTIAKSVETNSTLRGLDPNGDIQGVQVTTDGYLSISDNSSGLAIAEGEVSGRTFIHKFGDAPDFDVTDGFVNIWDGSDDANINVMQYTYSTTNDIDRLSSSDNGDTQQVEVQGLDVDYNLVLQTVTLTGQTPVSLPTPLLRVFRLKNVDTTNIAGFVYCYTSAATVTLGVPTPGNTIRASIANGNNQTLMAIYTIPAGKTGYMRDLFCSVSGAKRSSSHILKLLARPFEQVFQIKYKAAISDSGTSYMRHQYIEPEKFLEKTDIHMLVNTDQDQAGVSGGFDIVLVDN
jgi:hypothetical protein